MRYNKFTFIISLYKGKILAFTILLIRLEVTCYAQILLNELLSVPQFPQIYHTSPLEDTTISRIQNILEPVIFGGKPKISNSNYINGYHDSQLPPAIGVHNFQIPRANRSHPEYADGLGWTYNHAPMLALLERLLLLCLFIKPIRRTYIYWSNYAYPL